MDNSDSNNNFNNKAGTRAALSAKALGFANAELIERHKDEWDRLLRFYRNEVGLPTAPEAKPVKKRPKAPDHI